MDKKNILEKSLIINKIILHAFEEGEEEEKELKKIKQQIKEIQEKINYIKNKN